MRFTAKMIVPQILPMQSSDRLRNPVMRHGAILFACFQHGCAVSVSRRTVIAPYPHLIIDRIAQQTVGSRIHGRLSRIPSRNSGGQFFLCIVQPAPGVGSSIGQPLFAHLSNIHQLLHAR